MLRPQDILLSLKFLSPQSSALSSFAALASTLGLSVSESHASFQRAVSSGLLLPSPTRGGLLAESKPSIPALNDFLCHGVRYFLPARPGPLGLGIPTASSAPPLIDLISQDQTIPFVAPHPLGKIRGITVEPIYPSAPAASLKDPALGEWLALIDALRLHTGRVAELARDQIRTKLREYSHAVPA